MVSMGTGQARAWHEDIRGRLKRRAEKADLCSLVSDTSGQGTQAGKGPGEQGPRGLVAPGTAALTPLGELGPGPLLLEVGPALL